MDTDSTPLVPMKCDPLLDQLVGGRYRILERIGEGGVGTVYRGEHVGIGKAVAVKILQAFFATQPNFRKRFEREARAASKLSHPACVQVLDFGEVGDQLYLAMEYVQGKLLADRMDEGPITPTAALLITRTLASALRHAHGMGIVHRDVKPGNVMLLDAQTTGLPCKLLDFGLAKNLVAEAGEQGEALTQVGMVFGTPGYISPEQALGQSADARSDFYSLGAVLFNMLTGRRLFELDEPLQLLRAHIQTPAPPLRTLLPSASPVLEAFVADLLAKDPRKRPQNAEQIMARLATLPEFIGPGGATPNSVVEEISPPLPVRVALPAEDPPSLRTGPIVIGTVLAVLFGALSFRLSPYRRGAAASPVIAAQAFVPPATEQDRINIEVALQTTHAHDWISRLYCRDGLQAYERAIALDPQLRSDPQVFGDAFRCLEKGNKPRAVQFITKQIGEAAKPKLKSIALDPSQPPDVKKAAGQALARLEKRP